MKYVKLFLGEILLPEVSKVFVGSKVVVKCNDGYRINGSKKKSFELLCQVKFVKTCFIEISYNSFVKTDFFGYSLL